MKYGIQMGSDIHTTLRGFNNVASKNYTHKTEISEHYMRNFNVIFHNLNNCSKNVQVSIVYFQFYSHGFIS
jgi:hypothetical protein